MGPIRLIAVRLTAALSLPAFLPACAMLPDREPTVAAAIMPGQIESIHAAAFTKDLAVFWVSSNGCTGKEDLQPVVVGRGDASVITLRRIAEDRCETPLDDGVEVMWSFEELGIEPGAHVSVDNPYQLPQT